MKRYLILVPVFLLGFWSAVYAGNGVFVHIGNFSGTTINTTTPDVSCMYNTDYLNNLVIPNNTWNPGIYIESKKSGTCFFKTSKFTLNFNTAQGKDMGSLSFIINNLGLQYPPYNQNTFSVSGTSGSQVHLYITVK